MLAVIRLLVATVLAFATAGAVVWAVGGTIGLIIAVVTSGGSWLHIVSTLDHFIGAQGHVSADGTHVLVHSAYPVLEYIGWLALSWVLFGALFFVSTRFFKNQWPKRVA